jgi:hypothetical protein
MKLIVKILLFVTISFALVFSLIQTPSVHAGNPSECEVDTARIAVVELTVLGMDSITINDVQDKLDKTCGVSFNFACWTDTVVFIEYDSVLTNKLQLMALIRELGYTPSVRLEY